VATHFPIFTCSVQHRPDEAPDACFDLVLTDVIMPEMTGLEFGQRLASLHPTLPVLYVSGHTDRTLSTMLDSESETGADTE
jgi:FixJ family two-component response regulator